MYEGRPESDEMRNQRVSIFPRAGKLKQYTWYGSEADMLLETDWTT